MEIFEITVQRRMEAGWPVVAEHTRPSELAWRSEGQLKLVDEFKIELTMLLGVMVLSACRSDY